MSHVHTWRIGAPVRTTVVEERGGFDAIGLHFGTGVTAYRVDDCSGCDQKSVTYWEGADAKLAYRVDTRVLDVDAAMAALG